MEIAIIMPSWLPALDNQPTDVQIAESKGGGGIVINVRKEQKGGPPILNACDTLMQD